MALGCSGSGGHCISGAAAALGPLELPKRSFARHKGRSTADGIALASWIENQSRNRANNCTGMRTWRIGAFGALALYGALAVGTSCLRPAAAEDFKKHYWATSLSRSVDDAVLQGLYEAVARGEI